MRIGIIEGPGKNCFQCPWKKMQGTPVEIQDVDKRRTGETVEVTTPKGAITINQYTPYAYFVSPLIDIKKVDKDFLNRLRMHRWVCSKMVRRVEDVQPGTFNGLRGRLDSHA